MLIGKNFDDIDGETIQSLIDGKVPESVHLEFKRETYKNDDKGKNELLKDISAFANTLGGHLIIGMDEKEGIASSLKPISGNIDDELQRLENITRTGIEPIIAGLRIKRIDNENIIVIHIPRSFNPPHRVILNRSNRYYGRNSSGVHELSLEELRQSFGEQRSIEERAKAFIGQRFLSIQANDGIKQIPLKEGALVMHLVPLPDFGAERRIDVVKIKELQKKELFFRLIHDPIGFSWKINLEGCCSYFACDNTCYGYTQIFHNGVIEATSTTLFKHDEVIGLFFGSQTLPDCLIDALNSYMKGLHALEVTPPILLQISMMGIKGLHIGLDWKRFDRRPPYERDVMHLPASVIAEFRDDKNYQSVIAEQMHFLWNAFGFARCNLFNENDEWAPEWDPNRVVISHFPPPSSVQ